jgi:hypothetical protein
MRYLQDEQQSRPFRFTAHSLDEMFDVVRDLGGIQRNAIYLRLVRQQDGVAIGRTAMPHLPSSRRLVMLGAGRSDTTAFISSSVKIVPTPEVMSGSADFMITIDKNAKVEIGGPNPPRPAAPKAVEPAKLPQPQPDKPAAPKAEPPAGDDAAA